MSNNYFQFKQFLINQEDCAMKVGTDGVLLGAWAELSKAKHILDIGTGSGLLALMAAQRNLRAQIDAVEIEKSAYHQSVSNIRNSRWSDRISVFNSSIQDFTPKKKYDFIISNPPYFQHSLKPMDERKNLAKHDTKLTAKELAENINRLSTEDAEISLILPLENYTDFANLMRSHHFYLTKQTKVTTTSNKIPKRVLLQFSRQESECKTDELLMEKDAEHRYSESFMELVKDFYLGL